MVLTFDAGMLPDSASSLTYNWDGISVWNGTSGDGLSWAPGWLNAGGPFGVRTPDWTMLDQPIITGVTIPNATELMVTFSQNVSCATVPSSADLQQWNAMFFPQNQPSQSVMPNGYDCSGRANQIGLTFPSGLLGPPVPPGRLMFNSNGGVLSTTTPTVQARSQTVPIPY